GEYAKVNVIPLTDAPFKGWYEGNTLVSMDLEYKFTTMRDIELIAQFTSNDPTPTPTPKPSPGGGSGYIPTYPTNPASTSSVPTETITEEQMPESESSVASKFPALDKSGIMGYVSGYPDGTFGGNKNITRYEAAVLFYSIIIDNDKAGYVNEVSKFSDVPKDQWYSEAVGYLAAKGIVVGYPDGTFKGANLITRAEFATMVSKFEVYDDTGDMPFSDVHNEHWAANSIKNAYNKGWISGYPDGTFMPDKNITRAETVTIVNKLLGWTADISREYAVTFIDLADTDWFFIDVLLAANGLE
ncbi:MAG: S-layer homology domain-containing protein, partial [Firmicutes bacterium]|nr:S-layer homology domain-containing protein [Bacillota bacterium]